MESGQQDEDRMPLDKDQGFTMQFSIDVVDVSYPDAIADRVEDMMRLAAHGRFKEARDISDSELAPYSSMFPVATERMRLLLDQGAFKDLAKLTHTIDTSTFTQTQLQIVELMQAIAVTNEGNLAPMDLDWLFAEVDAAVDYFASDTLGLDDKSGPEHYPAWPMLPMSQRQYMNLLRVTDFSLKVGLFWVADILVPICCHPRAPAKDLPSGAMPDTERWPIYEVEKLTRILNVEKLSAAAQDDQIWLLGIAQSICDTLMRLKTYAYDGKDRTYALDTVIQQCTSFQTAVLGLHDRPQDVFGVRCTTRYHSIILYQRAIGNFQSNGIPFMSWDVEAAHNLLNTAVDNADDAIIESLTDGIDGDHLYRIRGFGPKSYSLRTSNVVLSIRQLDSMPLPSQFSDAEPASMLSDDSIAIPESGPATGKTPQKPDGFVFGSSLRHQAPASSNVANREITIAQQPSWPSGIPQPDLSQRYGRSRTGFKREYGQLKLQCKILQIRLMATRLDMEGERRHLLAGLFGEATVIVEGIETIRRRYEGQPNPSMIQRTRWKLHDHAKMQDLVTSLEKIVSNVENLSPRHERVESVATGAREDLLASDVRSRDIRANDIRANDVRANEIHATEIHATRIYATEVYATEIHAATVRAATVHAGDMRSAETHVSNGGKVLLGRPSSPVSSALEVLYYSVKAVQARVAYNRSYIPSWTVTSALARWRRLLSSVIFTNARERLTAEMAFYQSKSVQRSTVPQKAAPPYATKGSLVEDTKAALRELDRDPDNWEERLSANFGDMSEKYKADLRKLDREPDNWEEDLSAKFGSMVKKPKDIEPRKQSWREKSDKLRYVDPRTTRADEPLVLM